VDVEGGWYHITARGTERRTVFQDNRDHERFLELLAEMRRRYAVDVRAYALMGNHYHLLIRTPRANASAALQWLNFRADEPPQNPTILPRWARSAYSEEST